MEAKTPNQAADLTTAVCSVISAAEPNPALQRTRRRRAVLVEWRSLSRRLAAELIRSATGLAMIYCESLTLEQWQVPPHENSRGKRTKLFAAGVMLSNSIEDGDWDVNPAYPIVCEECWSSRCAEHGLARIVQLGQHLLWPPPRPCDFDESQRERLHEGSFIPETVVMPAATWEALRVRFFNLPPARSYPPALRCDVAAAWIRELPKAIGIRELADLGPRLREALASHPLDFDLAKEIVQRLVSWVLQEPEGTVEGRVVRSEDCVSGINTFYFDGRPFEEWPAFVVGWDVSFVLGAPLVFLAMDRYGNPPVG